VGQKNRTILIRHRIHELQTFKMVRFLRLKLIDIFGILSFLWSYANNI